MSELTSGLARVTIRAPRRRVDLAIPAQVPLAELLPDVVRRAGEAPPGGWILRRGDGCSLLGEAGLAPQGVRDGDVLYLVPRSLTWPEPAYDDVVEEIAAAARERGHAWDAATTRLFALVAAGLVLVAGLAVLMASGRGATGAGLVAAGLVAAGVCVALLGAGGLLSRALGDGVAGAATGGFALPYAAAAGVVLAAGDAPSPRPEHVLVGASALLLASVVGAVAIGYGLRVFTAGATTGILAAAGASFALAAGGPGAVAVLAVVAVAGIGLAPLAAVRLGKVPLPVVSASAGVLAAEQRPDRPAVLAAVARADEILAGCVLGVSLVALGCVGILAGAAGGAGALLGGLVSVALMLRARLFPTVAVRLPLLTAGLLGLATTAVAASVGMAVGTAPGVGHPGVGLLAGALGAGAVVVLLATAANTHRHRGERHGERHRERHGGEQDRGEGSPYLGRVADIADVATLVALVPVACAVLGLYTWVRGFGG